MSEHCFGSLIEKGSEVPCRMDIVGLLVAPDVVGGNGKVWVSVCDPTLRIYCKLRMVH